MDGIDLAVYFLIMKKSNEKVMCTTMNKKFAEQREIEGERT